MSLVLVLLASACTSGGQPALPPVTPVAASPAEVPATPTPVPTPVPLPELTLGSLFHPLPLNLDPSRLRTVIVTGDAIPAREVNVQATRRNDFLWPFRPTADYVKNADITYVNLETPLFAGCKLDDNGFRFCGDARFVAGLQAIGTKVVNVANNHFSNYGAQGTVATVDLLTKAGIAVSGLGAPAILDVKGLRFAFLGFNGVGLPIDREAVKAGIEHARAQADVVVVQFHWGKEYQRQPEPDPDVPTPDDPIAIGHLAIDDGADFVVGNHPHWYQGVEVYKGKLITYAHGNYVFDQMWSEETRRGVIGRYTFYDNRLVGAEWRPIRIYDYGQARFDDAAYDQLVVSGLEKASRDLAARLGEPGSW